MAAAVLLAVPARTETTASPDPAERLIREAVEKKLYQDSWWLKLLHYHRHFGRMRSDIDGGYFFLSPQGKTDPRAEMEATLRALISTSDLSPPMEAGMEAAAMHPVCKFRARLRFLQSHLDFPDSLLPEVDCSRYATWHNALRPTGVTLIFASSYLNNPASMFGHTFLRLNTYGGGSDRAVLNYGITYAANVPPGDDFSFVYKGILGAYKGSFGIVPYFVSLQKYSHLESRDIWEYDLNLDSIQIEYLIEHVWEVGACWMEYFFFDENCSSNMFTLLDAARPDANLAAGMDPTAIVPSETVKQLQTKPGLIKEVRWRPSLLTNFRLKTQTMGSGERGYLLDLIRTDSTKALPTPAFSPDTVSALMDVALDYVQYRKRRNEKDARNGGWASRQRSLLLARSAFPPSKTPYPALRDGQVTPPEQGHSAHAARLSAGVSGYRPFAELGLRFAYHDLNAAERGFLTGSQIEAFKVRLRAYSDPECGPGSGSGCGQGSGPEGAYRSARLELTAVDVLNIISITPVDFIRTPWSWTARVGLETRAAGARHGGASFTAEAGAGLSAAWRGTANALVFALAEAKLRGPKPDAWDASVGPQSRLGMRLGVGNAFSLLLENRLFLPLAGRMGLERDFTAEACVPIGRNSDLRAAAALFDEVGEASGTWNLYF